MEITETTPKATGRWKKYLVVLTILLIGASPFLGISLLFVPTGQYLAGVNDAVKNHGFSWESVAEIGWNTRWLIGQFRSAPTDAEMTTYLVQHKTDFDLLAVAYYEDVGITGSFSKTSERLKRRLRSLGLWNFDPVGPFIPEINKQGNSFQQMGVSFRLIDHGPQPWLSFDYKILKSYVYMPTVIPESAILPIDMVMNLRATGNYTEEANTDNPIRKIESDRCAVSRIDTNWLIIACSIDL